MKKYIAALLAVLLLVGLAACGQPQTEQSQTDGETQATDSTPAADPAGDPFVFTYEGVDIVLGADFDASKLPEAEYVFSQANCALNGEDVIYNYGAVEVTTYKEGESEIIQSVYIIDPNLPTPEGLALGDALTRVTELYGTDYAVVGDEWQFTKGKSILAILVQDDFAASIEYRYTLG